MPELPEVETIRRGLLGNIEGLRISNVEVSGSRVFQVDPKILIKSLKGNQIEGLERLGKFLIFPLEEMVLVIHLGMTGQLTLRKLSAKDSQEFLRDPLTGLQRIRQHVPDRHTHLQIHFDNKSSLVYRDIRMFGKIYLISLAKSARDCFFGKVGLEPFSKEYNIVDFLLRLSGRKLAVKSLLLDQSFVAGIGNIYADEILFESSIHPLRKVTTLSKSDRLKLYKSIKLVLKKAIQFGGTSLRDYIKSDGGKGSFQEELFVYGRVGEKCFQCKTLIEKIVVSQRGTSFCPNCQPYNS